VEPYAEIRPPELKRRLDAGEPPAILDVREPWEHELCAIPGARLIPMDQLERRVTELDPAGRSSCTATTGSARRRWSSGSGVRTSRP
jgi:rhodanese-related sulfurtransferase